CDSGSPTIANNIVAFNSSGIYRYDGLPSLRCNCVYNPGSYNYSGISPGTGDIQVDPQFVDLGNGNYHLLSSSPCIDAGYDNVVQPGWVDMDGQPRIISPHVDIGADEYHEYQPLPPISIPNCKTAVDGTAVRVTGAAVTAAFDGFFYIETDDRAAGIRVEKVGHGLVVGDRADVTGSMSTNSDGEKCILASEVMKSGEGSVKPLGLNNRSLGGGDWFYDPITGAGQRGVANGVGLNNIGLLVRTTGRVSSTGSDWFVIDDGSGVSVKCVVRAGVNPPAVGSYVLVTGISSCYKSSSVIYRLLRIRSTEDILVL
ncbi:MAG: choice-of-anchor Q domain-containing protein, partial [Armatimonadota bacterium]